MSIPHSQHQQYPTIIALAKKLEKLLSGAILNDAYTLSSDELVLVFQLPSNIFLPLKLFNNTNHVFYFLKKVNPKKYQTLKPVLMQSSVKLFNKLNII